MQLYCYSLLLVLAVPKINVTDKAWPGTWSTSSVTWSNSPNIFKGKL